MRLIKSLEIKEISKRRYLNKKASRCLRLRQYQKTEELIKQTLGDRYEAIGRPMTFDQIKDRFMKHNDAAYASETRFLKECLQNGISRGFYPNRCVLNRFFGDLVFTKKMIVVEVDGHSHKDPIQINRDRRKDYWLRFFGYTVIRVDATTAKGIKIGVSELLKVINCERPKCS
jgi:very-short-patch-repair endonuclease